MTDADLLKLWNSTRQDDPQRCFIYLALKARKFFPKPSGFFERWHYGLEKDEHIIFNATGNWVDQVFTSFDRNVRVTRLKFILATFIYGLGISLLTFFVLTNMDYTSGSLAAKKAKALLTFFFMLLPFIALWIVTRRPLFGIRYFLTNKTAGYCYTFFNLASLEPQSYPLPDNCFIAPFLGISYNTDIMRGAAYWRRDKTLLIFLSGDLYIVDNEKKVITMNLNVPKGLAFVHLLRCIAGDSGLGNAVNDIGFEGHLLSPDKIFLDKPSVNVNTISDYYKLWAMTGYVQNMAADDRFRAY